jgi:hypothetical protein
MLTDAQVRALVDRQLETERKARAWDLLRRRVSREADKLTLYGQPFVEYLDALENVAHPVHAAIKLIGTPPAGEG